MIFFLAHYYLSPLFNNKHLHSKAVVKLLVSGAIFAWAAHERFFSCDEGCAKLLLGYLIIESFLDIILFAVLLSSPHETTSTRVEKTGKRN